MATGAVRSPSSRVERTGFDVARDRSASSAFLRGWLALGAALVAFVRGPIEAVLLDLVEQRTVGELEESRGAGAVPAGALERAADQPPLQRLGLALDRQVGVRRHQRRARR